MTQYLKDYQPPAFAINHLTLDIQLAEQATQVTATLQMQRQHAAEDLYLHGEKLDLQSVKLNDTTLSEADYQLDPSSLTIVQVPDQFELQIVTELNPGENTELSGLYLSSGNFCTQCEAEGFRRITYFPDRPDVLTRFDVILTANKQNYPVLLSNGNLLATGDNSDGTHWAHWQDPHPKPGYLFALVAGDLQFMEEYYTTASGSKVQLRIYTQAHNIDKVDYAMQSLIRAMRWDEQVYGREYDLDVYNIVAVDDFNMGAMENKGLNIFNSKYVLASQDTATDKDFKDIEAVIGHEYFHNWSGNRVTCRDWFQLSLKEGFTVFREQQFSADMGSGGVKRIEDVNFLRSYQFKEDAGPLAHPVQPLEYEEINNFYTVTIYEKGAELIRMLYQLVGAAGFRAGTDDYFHRYDGQAVTIEAFIGSMERSNNIDLGQFRRWYSQAGTPEITVKTNYHKATKELRLTVTQSCPDTPGQTSKLPFSIPINTALFDQQGIMLQERTLLLTETKQQYTFGGLNNEPLLSLLRGFSAPVNLQFEYSIEQLEQLVEVETDGFARWEAMQRLYLEAVFGIINQSPDTKAVISALSKSWQRLLSKPGDDLALAAELLSLPTTSYVAEHIQPIRPQQVCDAVFQLTQTLARDNEDGLIHAYDLQNHQESYELSNQAMAQRAYKNTALRYLLQTEQAQHYETACKQYYKANNMTDRLAAFSALIHSQFNNKVAVISDFYAQWQDQPLVLDKWFAVQATAPEVQLLSRIHELIEHPSFSLSNPNKVRSLIGAFASNLRAFHRKDGASYAFLADLIVQLDRLNPQIAARLAVVFNNWRRFAKPYATQMQKQLLRIQANTNSPDVSEIVAKALAD